MFFGEENENEKEEKETRFVARRIICHDQDLVCAECQKNAVVLLRQIKSFANWAILIDFHEEGNSKSALLFKTKYGCSGIAKRELSGIPNNDRKKENEEKAVYLHQSCLHNLATYVCIKRMLHDYIKCKLLYLSKDNERENDERYAGKRRAFWVELMDGFFQSPVKIINDITYTGYIFLFHIRRFSLIGKLENENKEKSDANNNNDITKKMIKYAEESEEKVLDLECFFEWFKNVNRKTMRKLFKRPTDRNDFTSVCDWLFMQ